MNIMQYKFRHPLRSKELITSLRATFSQDPVEGLYSVCEHRLQG